MNTARLDRLQIKLFAAIAGTIAVLTLAAYAVFSWSFDRGFVDFINRADEARLEPLIATLAEGYAREGNWHWIANDRERWIELVRSRLGLPAPTTDGGRMPQTDARLPQSDAGPPQSDAVRASRSDAGPPQTDARLPESDAARTPQSDAGRAPRNDAGPPQTDAARTPQTDAGRAPQTAEPRRLPLTIDPRLLLFDQSRSLLIGRAELAGRAVLRPIAAEGRTVGYLGYVPRMELIESIERVYLSRQHVTFAGLAAAMLLASLALSAGMSYWLTRRVRALTTAARAMTAGHYDQRLAEHGHDEIAQLARDFNTLAEALEGARRARQQWIADIAHELRTPLSVLRGEIEALQDGVRSLDRAAVDSLASETARLARLIEDLHTLSMSDVGALSYFKEPVDIAEVIGEVVEPQRRALASRGLALKLDLEASIVMGDGERLAQLFANLLQNSVRYTDTPGTIAIRVRPQGGRVRIDWEDSAPGVPEADLARLTERLYRVEGSRSRAGGGSGLGLAIADALVRGHGGTLTTGASALGGLRVSIEFPCGEHAHG